MNHFKDKRYWRLLSKLEKRQDGQSYISNFTLVNHFKDLLQVRNPTVADAPTTSMTGGLDYPVTEEELKIASKILKAGKGTGIDTLRNEMIPHVIDLYPQLIIRSFNGIIIQQKELCQDWLHSLITAIHKKRG